MIGALALGAAVSAVAMLLGLAVVMPRLRKLGVVDVPVDRSLHSRPVVRGAGLALLPAIVIGVIVTRYAVSRASATPVELSGALMLVLVVVALASFACIGLADDLFSVSVLTRVVAQLIVSALALIAVFSLVGVSAVWVPPLAVAVTAAVNVTNFMDGANGMLALHGVIAGLWFTALSLWHELPNAASMSVVMCGVLAGFFPVNGRGAAFMGDVGSYTVGAAWAFISLWLLGGGVPVEAVGAPLLVFVADAAYTLQLRVRARERWYQPHKLHVYQRLVSAGWPHLASSAMVSAVAVACCVLALPAALGATMPWRAASASVMVLVLAIYLRLPVFVHAPEPWRGRRTSAQVRPGVLDSADESAAGSAARESVSAEKDPIEPPEWRR